MSAPMERPRCSTGLPRSHSVTRTPARASVKAAKRPQGPAPITTTCLPPPTPSPSPSPLPSPPPSPPASPPPPPPPTYLLMEKESDCTSSCRPVGSASFSGALMPMRSPILVPALPSCRLAWVAFLFSRSSRIERSSADPFLANCAMSDVGSFTGSTTACCLERTTLPSRKGGLRSCTTTWVRSSPSSSSSAPSLIRTIPDARSLSSSHRSASRARAAARWLTRFFICSSRLAKRDSSPRKGSCDESTTCPPSSPSDSYHSRSRSRESSSSPCTSPASSAHSAPSPSAFPCPASPCRSPAGVGSGVAEMCEAEPVPPPGVWLIGV
mmetsp:Transcript_25408/g.75478  ORF Transcript_25408/g.75478 Transcript_25408/m.75478 type:complete len:325 (+) Transcript_25408:392-1366(+)